MKKTQKIILLILVLLAPIMVFLFLKKFGVNQFELPLYYVDGNPISQCDDIAGTPHRVKSDFIDDGSIVLPAIFIASKPKENEYYSDLENVLAKYPIKVWEVLKSKQVEIDSHQHVLFLDEDTYLNFINCQLALGENHWVDNGIANKYVLVDKEGRIRGYIEATTLKEIERLDTEVDILLNY